MSDRPFSPRANRGPVLWGIVLLAGGLAAWHSVADRETVPVAWQETAGPSGPASRMAAELRSGGPSDLLRLEWPAHPRARSYEVRFEGASAPVTVQGTVFLYDLQSNVLHLPSDFGWEVSAVLPDGSEVVTPSQRVDLDAKP